MDSEPNAKRPLLDRTVTVVFWAVLLGSRVVARQKSLWEWDDHLFGLALRAFRPLEGVPHPPFYPAYVFAARLLRPIVGGDEAALTWLSVISSGAALVFLYRILRELALGRRMASAATALFAFFPAVWLHSGAPLSDPLGTCLAYLTLWLALRGLRREDSGVVVAGLAFGLAVAARPQTALIALPALVAAVWKNLGTRAWGAAGAAAVAFVGAFVVPVVRACHGVAPALLLLRNQGHYVMSTDSRFARGFDIAQLAGRYLIDIWGSDVLALGVTALAAAGLALIALERRRGILVWLAVSFLPYLVVCWIFLDPGVAGRYAMPYLPLYAVPIAFLFDRLERRFLVPFPIFSAATVVFSALVIFPAIRLIHTQLSPPEQAAEEIRRQARGRRFSVIFDAAMVPSVNFYFPDAQLVSEEDVDRAQPSALTRLPIWEYRKRQDDDLAGFSAWPDLPALSRVGRGRFMAVYRNRWMPHPRFGEGFYDQESYAGDDGRIVVFHWMSRRGTILFPPSRESERIAFELVVPRDGLKADPSYSVSVNGKLLQAGTLACNPCPEEISLPATLLSGDKWNEMVITTDEAVVPASRGGSSDKRELGLQLRRLSVTPTGSG